MAGDQEFDVQMSPASEAALKQQVAEFPDKLKDELRKQLGAEGDQIVSAMRAKVLQSPPSAGQPTRRAHNSRRQTAAGLGYTLSDQSDGVALDLRISTDALPRIHRGFPWVYNKPSWNHPVFGRSPGVTQHGRPFIDNSVQEKAKAVEESVEKALTSAGETVKGSTT